jgi:hypothetical protein
MSLVQRDYILRLIEAVAAALARVMRRKESGDLSGARREIYMACTELLGPLAPVVPHADVRTASDLLGDPRRVAAWARLLAEDAELLRLMGQEEAAGTMDRRACSLLLEAYAAGGELDADAAATLLRVRERVPLTDLEPRHREALAALERPERPAA